MNRGEAFERQFIASLPAGIWHRKLSTPVPPARNNGAVLGLLERLARQAREEVPGWAVASLTRTSHTPNQPFDLLISAPAVMPVPIDGPALPGPDGIGCACSVSRRVDFALELKSAGASKSLPFSLVKSHQIAGLAKARAAGLVAGLVVEFADVAPGGLVVFIPVEVLVAHIASCGRKSLSFVAAEEIGVRIELNPGRGRERRYWRVGSFLARFGADVI